MARIGYTIYHMSDKDLAEALRVAGRYIDFAERTERQVRQRLEHAGFELAIIDEALERLAAAGLVDDARFADQWAEGRTRTRSHGPARLAADMRRQGLDADEIDQALAGLDPEQTQEAAIAFLRRRAPAGRPDADAVRRLIAMLRRRGHSGDTIRAAIRTVLDAEPDDDAPDGAGEDTP